MRARTRLLSTLSAARRRLYNPTALTRLAADAEEIGGGPPVMLVDAVKLADRHAWAKHGEAVRRMDGLTSRIVLKPHAHGILLGDEEAHDFDEVVVSCWDSAASAYASLRHISLKSLRTAAMASGSWLSRGGRSSQFSGMATFEHELAPVDTSPPQPVLDSCPFVRCPSGSSHPAAWETLQSEPSAPMYALNLIRRPADPAAYSEYGRHFAHLPEAYGMRFVEAAELSRELLVGEPAADGEAADEGHDMMVVVYFPSSECFVKAWSDPVIARDAFPLRAGLVEQGFEHVWLHCSREWPLSRNAQKWA